MAFNISMDEAMKRLGEVQATLTTLETNLDVLYLFLSGTIVLLMQAGFAFLECGVVRTKNTTNILLVTLMDLYISGIAYFLVGWAFSKGAGNGFIGWTQFALNGLDDVQLCQWFFRCVVAALVATLISGAVSERCNFIAHGVYSCFVSGFIFPVVAHWAWSEDGWLFRGKGGYHYVDFAGSGVVHLVGGVCSFVASYIIGPRIGRFDPYSGRANEIKGHSMPMTSLGGFILVFGLVSFNAGSKRHISQAGDGDAVALMVSNTMIAGSFGCVSALIIYKSGIFGTPKQWSFLPSLNGAITAMVATAAAGDHYPQWGSAIVGMGGSFVFFGVRSLVLYLKVDDPVECVAVHFGGGVWGLIAAIVFARSDSLLHSDKPYRAYWLLWNLTGIIAIIGWAAGCSIVLFGTMKKLRMLRVSPMVEVRGLDLSKHGEPAYPVEGWEEEQYSYYATENGDFLNKAPNATHALGVGVLPVMLGPCLLEQGISIQNGKKLNLESYFPGGPTHRTNPAFETDAPAI